MYETNIGTIANFGSRAFFEKGFDLGRMSSSVLRYLLLWFSDYQLPRNLELTSPCLMLGLKDLSNFSPSLGLRAQSPSPCYRPGLWLPAFKNNTHSLPHLPQSISTVLLITANLHEHVICLYTIVLPRTSVKELKNLNALSTILIIDSSCFSITH